MVFLNYTGEDLALLTPGRINVFLREEIREDFMGEETITTKTKVYVSTLNDDNNISRLSAIEKIHSLASTLGISDYKLIKLVLINEYYTRDINQITSSFPDGEILTWTRQETEARAYLEDSSVSTPFIDSLAKSRGMDKDELVEKIIQKADLFAQASAMLTGKRQKIEDSIQAAETLEELDSIKW